MKKYTYERPEGKMYKVSVRKWNKFFDSRGDWPFVTSHVFVSYGKGVAVIHHYCTIWAKLMVLVLLPFMIVFFGWKEVADTVKNCWFQRAREEFEQDEIFSGGEDWEKLMELIKQ